MIQNKQQNAMETLKDISDVSWFVDQHLDKLDHLYRALQLKQKSALKNKYKKSQRLIISPKVRFFKTLQLSQPISRNYLQLHYHQKRLQYCRDQNKPKIRQRIKSQLRCSPKLKRQNHSTIAVELSKNLHIDGLSLLKSNNIKDKSFQTSQMFSPKKNINSSKRMFMGRPIYSSRQRRRLFSTRT